MRFIQYFDYDLNGDLLPALGSDAILKIDGRLALCNQVSAGMRRAWQLERIRKYPAFKIYQGRNFSDSKPVSGFFNPQY